MFHVCLLPPLQSTASANPLVRRIQIFTVALLACAVNARAQNPFEPSFNIACVERIALPQYPELARQRRVEGAVNATVVLSPHAAAELITTDFASRNDKVIGILIRTVEDTIRAATYRSSCGGKTLSFVFDFRISGKQSAAFGYPNKFWITSEPGAAVSSSLP